MKRNILERQRNGHNDSGKNITPDEKCPNCGSSEYKQTVSTESCSDCGLYFDYWGGGANDVYKRMMEK